MNQEKKKGIGKDLTQGPVFEELVLFAIPIIFTNVIQQVYSMADLAIVGRFAGSAGTVGVSTGGELSDFLTPAASAIAMAGQVYISQLAGAKETKQMKEALGTMLFFMMICSAAAMAVPIVFCREILEILNCPPEALKQAANYMVICSFGMPFVFGYNAVCAMLRGIGESKRPMIFIAISAAVNILLDILLVAVIPLQAAGTAIATVAAQIGAFIASFYFLYRHRDAFDFQFKPSYFKLRWRHLRVILRLGVPQLVRTFCVRFSMLWVKAGINSFGLAYSAAYSVGSKLEKFMDVFFTGFTAAGAAMIGQNFGARDMQRVQKTQNATLCCAAVFGGIASLLFLVVPVPMFRIFTREPEVIGYGVIYCRIMAVGVILNSISSSYKCMATGAGEAALCLGIGVLDGTSRILVCCIAVYLFHAGAFGYYWGAALCHLLPGVVSFLYYARGKWRTKKLLIEA